MFARTQRPSIRQRLAIWLAACAIAFGVLSPALAQVLITAPASPAGWVDVCTSTGMVRVQVSDTEVDLSAKGQPVPALAAMDCEWCVVHAAHIALPPVLAGLSLPVAPSVASPIFVSQTPPIWRAWSPAHSRAPPSQI